MARKKLSAHGRVLAAGVSVAVAGGLAGFMAARDHSADVSQPTSSSSSVSSDGIGTSGASSSGTPAQFPDDQRGSGDTTGQLQPQPQTRTGGS